MDFEFSRQKYYGYIIKADLHGAMDYLKTFPQMKALSDRFHSVFIGEEYISYNVDPSLNEILKVYQKYFRDVFYLGLSMEEAERNLSNGLAFLFSADCRDLDILEACYAARQFTEFGYSFLGGRTGGFYGPYVWKTTESRTYMVELPDGVQEYTVNLLDGFIFKSWIDYLSFGEVGTGGWTDSDGIINCIKSAYDLESESFQVSLLKHEAQHAQDLRRGKDISSEQLEYRAKLVELIYSRERNLMSQFLQEADASRGSNGHAAAAYRIVEGFRREFGLPAEKLGQISADLIRRTAWKLFEESA